MTIHYDASTRIFHLSTKGTSYAMQITEQGALAHLYWGRNVRTSVSLNKLFRSVERASFSPNPYPEDRSLSFDTMPQEFPAFGTGDYRQPAYQVQLENGTTVTELVYRSHRIVAGKPSLPGLPATYAEAEQEADTLIVELADVKAGLVVELTYTAFHDYDAITRSARILNTGSTSLRLLRAFSMSVDFPHANFETLNLHGAWARERHISRGPLQHGLFQVSSARGSSSHMQNPFLALLAPGTDEENGDVYAVNLVYSGNFTAQAGVDQFATTRLSIGLNTLDFNWLLEPGEAFQTPEAVMVYSHTGLGGMSRKFHKLYRERLCRGMFRDRTRPVLVNNWEATYFQFNADKIESIAQAGQDLGIELFVLDDGWFGKRDSDNCSLGDWFVDRKKLPGGLPDLVQRVRDLGMEFGLWFEPEMVSPDSDLYRAHPDWCLHVPDRRRSEGRQQLILDFSRQEVRQAVYTMLSDILRSAPITYVKWDMNRNMTEVGSAALPAERQRETAHRYILGLYETLERLTAEFPHILFESCSGGGGRFDPGMLYYMPQTWTSDNTDAISRLKIQYGTSLVYPISTMGAHVSAVPNHQVHRSVPLEMRGHVAMSGNFGYELDLTKFTDEEKTLVKEQVAAYKELRHLVQFGEQYRLLSPFEGNETAWMVVAEDRSDAVLAYFQVLAEPNPVLRKLRLKGLDPNRTYVLDATGDSYGGDELMYIGINLPILGGDFQSLLWRFRAQE